MMDTFHKTTFKAAFISLVLLPNKRACGLRVPFAPFGRAQNAKLIHRDRLKPSRSFHTSSLKCNAEKKIKELGLSLPPPSPARANYAVFTYAPGPNHDKEMMYLSGHLPLLNDGTILKGFVGPDSGGKSIEEGKEAARQTALNVVSTLKNELGDLNRVAQIVKVFGIVNSHTDFKDQHLVMNGFSDVMIDIFGKDVGYHARSAIGTNTLPLDITVEVEAIVRIKPQ